MYRDHVKTVKKKRCMSESTKIVKEHEYLKSKAHELREELEKVTFILPDKGQPFTCRYT